jgi:hypothetical protein
MNNYSYKPIGATQEYLGIFGKASEGLPQIGTISLFKREIINL